MLQAHVFISGFVQGVGYRAFVRKNARKMDVNGWVQNLPDRRVEAVFQGSKEKIEELIKICEKGPFLSEVKNVVVDWEEMGEEYVDFEIYR